MTVTRPARSPETAAPPRAPVAGAAPPRPPHREAAARTYARALPVVPVRARGMTVEGADGRRYLDCLSGGGTLALGHNHPVVLEAIRSVLDSGAPLHALDFATPVRDSFIAELLRSLPGDLAKRARVRFCGPAEGDAVRTALSLVADATGRPGRSEPPAPLVPCAADRRPMGDRPADDRLRALRASTAARGMPLVVDETETGVGRTGAFWAVEHSGVVPDVMVLSKAIGGSFPLAVVVHREDLGPQPSEDAPEALHGNQLALAAGAATLVHVRRHRLAERAAAVGGRMLDRLGRLAGCHPCVAEVRGRGLMIGLRMADPSGERVTAAPGPETRAVAAAVRREALRRGLIVGLGTGPQAGVVRLLPPLTISDEQAEAVLDRLSDAIAAVERDRGALLLPGGSPPGTAVSPSAPSSPAPAMDP
ncbi:aminotransferase class III-fold pyridoxal phosphate-dependent enzyme [Streptomyces sp. URMC 123]|uniref:aminotransferase class III-fold pyridoxal phosphate-dependent enzyme n=1 Tax=Streptomyces sp. URMC 123 TaxID=3423403 RepID=UPI003F1C59EA